MTWGLDVFFVPESPACSCWCDGDPSRSSHLSRSWQPCCHLHTRSIVMSTRQYTFAAAALSPLALTVASHAANLTVRVQNLVSNSTDIPARTTDETLLNPWGLAISPTAPIWIANNGTGLSTLFTPQGVRQTATVELPMSGV